MAFDPGALNASLAAAVGSDPQLMAELKTAFIMRHDVKATVAAK